MSNQSGKAILVLILLLLVLGYISYFFLQRYSNQKGLDDSVNINYQEVSNQSNPDNKEYISKNFKVSFSVPPNFQIEDNFPILILNNEGKKIEIVRNGTNFENLSDYLEDFDTKRKIEVINKKENKINNYPVIHREMTLGNSSGRQKSIYLYVDNYVYIFSTSDQSLYPILDQIVQSFEYKP